MDDNENKDLELPKVKEEADSENIIREDMISLNELDNNESEKQVEEDEKQEDNREKVLEEEKNEQEEKIENLKEDNKKKNRFYNICYIIVFGLLFIWLGIWFTEYKNITDGNDPKFCLKTDVVEYDDGTVDICTGIGYKVINYKRESYKALEIGPFWIKERSNILKK